MSVRPAGFAALAAALVLPGVPQSSPVVAKYKLRQELQQELDLSAVGQGKQITNLNRNTYVTLNLGDTTGGRTVHLVVDSVVFDTTAQLPPQARAIFEGLKGQAFHGYLINGKVNGLTGVKGDSVAAAQATQIANELFVRTKPSAKAGDTWTDTNNVSNAGLTVRTLTTYKAGGTDASSGQKGMKVDATTSSSFSGNQGGSAIEGTGTGSGSYVVGADGRVLSGSLQATSNLSVAPPQAPEPLPVLIKQSVTITSLK